MDMCEHLVPVGTGIKCLECLPRWEYLSRIANGELDRAAYMRGYNRGWRHSSTANASLDNCPPGAVGWAWEDGYLDYASGRDKYHLRDCRSHDECG
jgi:hypothetical protein